MSNVFHKASKGMDLLRQAYALFVEAWDDAQDEDALGIFERHLKEEINETLEYTSKQSWDESRDYAEESVERLRKLQIKANNDLQERRAQQTRDYIDSYGQEEMSVRDFHDWLNDNLAVMHRGVLVTTGPVTDGGFIVMSRETHAHLMHVVSGQSFICKCTDGTVIVCVNHRADKYVFEPLVKQTTGEGL